MSCPSSRVQKTKRGIDISELRKKTVCVTLDDGYAKHRLVRERYFVHRRRKGHPALSRHPNRGARGEIVVHRDGLSADLTGHLPTRTELRRFSELLTQNEMLHEDMKFHFEGFPPNAHPMAILSIDDQRGKAVFHPRLMEGYKPHGV